MQVPVPSHTCHRLANPNNTCPPQIIQSALHITISPAGESSTSTSADSSGRKKIILVLTDIVEDVDNPGMWNFLVMTCSRVDTQTVGPLAQPDQFQDAEKEVDVVVSRLFEATEEEVEEANERALEELKERIMAHLNSRPDAPLVSTAFEDWRKFVETRLTGSINTSSPSWAGVTLEVRKVDLTGTLGTSGFVTATFNDRTKTMMPVRKGLKRFPIPNSFKSGRGAPDTLSA